MSTPDIERLLASVPTGLWIGGEERPGASTFDVLDPSNDQVLTKVANATDVLLCMVVLLLCNKTPPSKGGSLCGPWLPAYY